MLNHIGAPLGIGPYAGQRDEVFATWSASMRELAACQNVHVKLGGLGMGRYGNGFHEQPRPPSSEELADGLEAVHRDLHRGVRGLALHVREQLPGRQGRLHLRGVLERLQDAGARRERRGEDATCSSGRPRGSTGSTWTARPEERVREHEEGRRGGADVPRGQSPAAGSVRLAADRRPTRAGDAARPLQRRRPRVHRRGPACSSWRRPTRRASRTSRTRAACPASCGSSTSRRWPSRTTTATACSRAWATSWSTRRSACCSSTSRTRVGCGSTARRASRTTIRCWPSSPAPSRSCGSAPSGSSRTARATSTACSSSSTRSTRPEQGHEPPEPDWKRMEVFRDALPRRGRRAASPIVMRHRGSAVGRTPGEHGREVTAATCARRGSCSRARTVRRGGPDAPRSPRVSPLRRRR